MLRHLTVSDLELVREMSLMGATVSEIADALEMTIAQFRRMRMVYPELDKALRDWMEEADDNVERALYRKALSGDVNAAKTWLSQRKPEQWNRKAAKQQNENDTVLVATGIIREGDDGEVPVDTSGASRKDTVKQITHDKGEKKQ